MQLALYGNRFTLYGRPLVLYGSTPTPPDGGGLGGGGSSQLPHIRVDRQGRPVSEEHRQPRIRAKTVRDTIDEELDRLRKPPEQPKPDEIKPRPRRKLTVSPPDITAPIAAIQAQIDAAVALESALALQAVMDDELATEMLLLSM
jgi:hypothetical protein